MEEVSEEPLLDHIKAPIDIDPNGDLLLRLNHAGTGADYVYRVSNIALRRASPYFNVLLDPSKFSEGIAVEKRLKAVRELHGATGAIPFSKLPMIFIPDIGQVPRGTSTESAVSLFLHILHKDDTAWPAPRLSVVALIAIIADRFAATTPIANYCIQQNWKSKLIAQKGVTSSHEVRIRQELLIGLILRFPDWVRQYSATLVVQGSEKWREDCEARKESEALWWNLPNGLEGKRSLESAISLSITLSCFSAVCCYFGIDMQTFPTRILERTSFAFISWTYPRVFLALKSRVSLTWQSDELLCRRQYVLETISSIQSHFINLYASKQPQCKLCYDSSPQCDSFQLGEMVRFFSRKGLLHLQSTFTEPTDNLTYSGSVANLLHTLRECPTYQIDRNHTHCGLRSRFYPALEFIKPLSQVGLCLHCWKDGQDSWLERPTEGMWSPVTPRLRPPSASCRDHLSFKAMYTAERRDWTPAP